MPLLRERARARKRERVNSMLDHEKLDVYKVSIEFMAIAIKLAENIPRGYSSLADQLKRAAWSIPLNIAEGCGKSTRKDKEDSTLFQEVRLWNVLLF